VSVVDAATTSANEAAASLTMEQHAGIAVALAEGFARAQVLAQEQVDEDTFRAADVEWKQRLVEDARGEGTLFARYQAKRAEAEDWLWRKVSPLGDDLGAWLGFLKAWAAAAAPYGLLASAGLTLADVGRLGRAWEAALARDGKLAKRAAKLAGDARMPARVTVEPVELRPFPWSPKPQPKAVEGAGARDALSSAIAAAVVIDVADVAVVPVTPSYLRPGPAGAAAGRATPGPAAVLPSYARAVAPDATAPVFYLRGGDGLPFAAGGDGGGQGNAPEALKPVIAEAGVGKVPAAPSGETVLAVEIPKGRSLPFESGAKARAQGSAGIAQGGAGIAGGGAGIAGGGASSEKEAAPQAMGTLAVFELPKGPALPFGPSPAALAAPAAPPRPAAPGGGPAVPMAARPAAQSGETVLSDGPVSAAAAAATPFQEQAPPDGAAPTRAASAAGPARAAPPPSWSLVDHATLCAEIGLRAARLAETLARCGLDAASKTALDRRFNELRAADPAAEVAWNKAYQAAYAKLWICPWKGPGAT